MILFLFFFFFTVFYFVLFFFFFSSRRRHTRWTGEWSSDVCSSDLAYNAAATLAATIADFPPGCVDEVLLVDDCSKDNTVEIARKMGLTVIVHDKNTGYGGNQKTCYKYCLEHGADVVVMIHPDYQYDARVIPHAIGMIELGICDVILGNRVRSRAEALKCGMPWWKYLSNRGLTAFENFFLGQNLGEFHSGFRVYRRQVLETIPFERNSNDFVFD